MFKREPALIIGFIHAALLLGVSFGLKLTPDQIGAFAAFFAASSALFTRAIVSSPATTETLAKGTLRNQPSPAQTEKAAEVLGVPAPLIQEAVRFAAQGLLPTNWAALIVGTDFSRLATAVNEARKRAPRQDETDAHVLEGL